MAELILPTTRLHAAFLECRDDWGPGLHEDGFGLIPEDGRVCVIRPGIRARRNRALET